MEKISGAADENTRMELEPSHEVGSRQKTLAFFGCGLKGVSEWVGGWMGGWMDGWVGE